KLVGTGKVQVSGEAVLLMREAWRDLWEKLGTNKPNCVLVCDNLNEPQSIAAELKTLAGKTPWVGVSHVFRFDLPFDRAQVDGLAQGKRGVSLLAISGEVETQVEVLSGMDPRPIPPGQNADPDWEQKWKRFTDQERERLAPSVDGFLERLRLPDNLPDHLLFLF